MKGEKEIVVKMKMNDGRNKRGVANEEYAIVESVPVVGQDEVDLVWVFHG